MAVILTVNVIRIKIEFGYFDFLVCLWIYKYCVYILYIDFLIIRIIIIVVVKFINVF